MSIVSFSGCEVAYELVENEHEADFSIAEERDADPARIAEAIRAAATDCYWFLQPNFRECPPRERFDIILAPEAKVELYNFGRDALGGKASVVASWLARFYGQMRDRRNWRISSVQVMGSDVGNGKSGEFRRGCEFPAHNRFELYPASFAPGRYRDTVNCPWIAGAIIHEATHLCFEEPLALLWKKHREDLGWIQVQDGERIRLPGGSLSMDFNRFPRRCPTAYASYQQDDDRAESCVLFMIEPSRLDRLRSMLVGTVLMTEAYEHTPTIVRREPELPAIHQLRVFPTGVDTGFGAVGESRADKPIRAYDLREYRTMHGV